MNSLCVFCLGKSLDHLIRLCVAHTYIISLPIEMLFRKFMWEVEGGSWKAEFITNRLPKLWCNFSVFEFSIKDKTKNEEKFLSLLSYYFFIHIDLVWSSGGRENGKIDFNWFPHMSGANEWWGECWNLFYELLCAYASWICRWTDRRLEVLIICLAWIRITCSHSLPTEVSLHFSDLFSI